MSTRFHRTLFIVILLLLILACSVPNVVPVVDPNAASTAAALTISAAIQNIATSSPLPTASPLPTLPPAQPPTLTRTPLVTASPLPGLTTTLVGVPVMTVSVDTNCRVGPGKAYELVGALLVGEKAEVFAKDPTSNYWYIRNPDKPGTFCWAWGEYATITGNTSALPVYTPPPTPTPSPDFEVNYSNKDSCVGYWVEFAIKNIGGIPFESISMEVKDTTTSTVLSSVFNEFTNIKGCASSDSVDPLEAGETVVVSSPAFASKINGHKFRATITLCTSDGLTGVCVSKTITFKT